MFAGPGDQQTVSCIMSFFEISAYSHKGEKGKEEVPALYKFSPSIFFSMNALLFSN